MQIENIRYAKAVLLLNTATGITSCDKEIPVGIVYYVFTLLLAEPVCSKEQKLNLDVDF